MPVPDPARHRVSSARRFRRPALLLAAAFALTSLAAFAPPLWAAGGGGGDDISNRDPHFIQATALIKKQQWAEAERVLKDWIAEAPREADAHNLLGYVTRKQGRLQEALDHYRDALRIDPKHRGAHEYMGETWLLLGNLAEARKHLAFLDDDCFFPCEEYTDLKEAVAEYEKAKRS